MLLGFQGRTSSAQLGRQCHAALTAINSPPGEGQCQEWQLRHRRLLPLAIAATGQWRSNGHHDHPDKIAIKLALLHWYNTATLIKLCDEQITFIHCITHNTTQNSQIAEIWRTQTHEKRKHTLKLPCDMSEMRQNVDDVLHVKQTSTQSHACEHIGQMRASHQCVSYKLHLIKLHLIKLHKSLVSVSHTCKTRIRRTMFTEMTIANPHNISMT